MPLKPTSDQLAMLARGPQALIGSDSTGSALVADGGITLV